MRKVLLKLTLCLFFLTAACGRADAYFFDLDTIASWGKFPRFCVNTYRWGDKFFNGYDSAYVAPTGYKFNVKTTCDSWTQAYRFQLPDNKYIFMFSEPSTSIGLYATYLAVSVGYDVNISKLFGNRETARKRWRFGFNCMLFAAEVYYIRDNGSSRIRRFGDYNNPGHYNLPFRGIDNTTWGIDAYYFFNHKKYSEAASFNFSRIQKRSQGAFYTGFSIYTQKLDFNFRELPSDLIIQLPPSWKNAHYRVNTHNYAVRLGYGYNWVFHRNWVLGVSESPIVGIRKGFVNSDIEKVSFSMYNRMKLSVCWNHNRWFFGATGKFDLAIINDEKTNYAGAVLSAEAVAGFRFNIW